MESPNNKLLGPAGDGSTPPNSGMLLVVRWTGAERISFRAESGIGQHLMRSAPLQVTPEAHLTFSEKKADCEAWRTAQGGRG
jgi:hypothetical protein